jgi:hypothetical protein
VGQCLGKSVTQTAIFHIDPLHHRVTDFSYRLLTAKPVEFFTCSHRVGKVRLKRFLFCYGVVNTTRSHVTERSRLSLVMFLFPSRVSYGFIRCYFKLRMDSHDEVSLVPKNRFTHGR